MRHIKVRKLRVQDRVAKGELEIKKVKGEENVADGLTKHVECAKMDYCMRECGFVRRSGRHELCPRLGDDKRVHGDGFAIHDLQRQPWP